MSRRGLSKSKLLSYRQCPKRLWLETYQPELVEIDPATQARFDGGNVVGEIARTLYGPGELLYDSDTADFSGALKRTHDSLAAAGRKPLFEATFSADNVLVMADVIKRVKGGVRAIEVKSSTSVKDYHVEDCAVQAHVIESCGQTLRGISVAHVDTSFVYPGDGDYRGLLNEVDVTGDVAALRSTVPKWIRGARKTLKGDEPDIAPGAQCTKPFTCPFYDHCNVETTEYPVTVLPYIGKLGASLAERGIEDVRKVPRHELRREDQRRVYDATRSGKAILNKAAAAAVRDLPYPRYYLDFETVQFAAPIWPGTRPYQQIPFQWSLHVEKAAGHIEHLEFLDLSGANPAAACIQTLLRALGSKGSILVYSGFEQRILKDMARLLPKMAMRINRVIKRLVDLLVVTQASYYHPQMMGSWSIKAVLPTIAPDLRYDQLDEIADGLAAQRAFIEATDTGTSADRREQIRDRLLEYCGLDSLAMLRVAAFLSSGSTGRIGRKALPTAVDRRSSGRSSNAK